MVISKTYRNSPVSLYRVWVFFESRCNQKSYCGESEKSIGEYRLVPIMCSLLQLPIKILLFYNALWLWPFWRHDRSVVPVLSRYFCGITAPLTSIASIVKLKVNLTNSKFPKIWNFEFQTILEIFHSCQFYT